jgi:hypothetical protein
VPANATMESARSQKHEGGTMQACRQWGRIGKRNELI